MKTCPYCAEEIQDAAVVCKHCGRDLAPTTPPAPTAADDAAKRAEVNRRANRSLLKLIGAFVLVLVICMIGMMMIPRSDAPAPTVVPPAQSNPPVTPPKSEFLNIRAKCTTDGVTMTVENDDTFDWRSVELELNKPGVFSDGYTVHVGSIAHGKQVTVGLLRFTMANGTRFNPIQARPVRLDITAFAPDGRHGGAIVSWQQ